MTGPRHQGREAALQVLYFWEVGRTDPEAALDAYFDEHRPDAGENVREFASEIVRGTIAELADLDRLIQAHSEHWRLERLAIVDRLILRMAAWELKHETGTAPAIVMNEAIELARHFSSEDAGRFVNGVLDAIHRALVKDGAA